MHRTNTGQRCDEPRQKCLNPQQRTPTPPKRAKMVESRFFHIPEPSLYGYPPRPQCGVCKRSAGTTSMEQAKKPKEAKKKGREIGTTPQRWVEEVSVAAPPPSLALMQQVSVSILLEPGLLVGVRTGRRWRGGDSGLGSGPRRVHGRPGRVPISHCVTSQTENEKEKDAQKRVFLTCMRKSPYIVKQ